MTRMLSAMLLAFAALISTTTAYAAPTPVGLWRGEIEAGANRIIVVVAIETGENESFQGSLEIPGQVGAPKLPLANVVASEESLAFDIPAIASRYEGEWSPETSKWVGIWIQSGRELPLALASGRPQSLPSFPELDGTWKGAIERNGQPVRFIFRFATSEGGTAGSFAAPAVGLENIPLSQISLDRGNLSFIIPATGASFEGTLAPDVNALEGLWSFPGQPATNLRLERDQATLQLERDQNDSSAEPHLAGGRVDDSDGMTSYAQEEVTFPGGDRGDFKLAGTLTVPSGSGPFPAVVLLTGSGPQDRDQTLFGHKPFAVIADHLTRNGIAVLRYDDRGVAKSEGSFITATSADFADDAIAAITYLKQREEIDAKSIGLIGHSEGAIVANLAALASSEVSFLISLAGPGMDFAELQLAQRRALAKQAGFPEEAVLRSEPLIMQFYEALLASPDQQTAKATAEEMLTADLLQALGANEAMKDNLASHFSRDWFRFLLNHNAPFTLARLEIPVLAIAGSLDQQVPTAPNVAGIRQALADNKDATVEEVPGVNHMLQTATTGSMSEYEEIEETVSPVVLNLLTEWINARF